MDPIEAKKQWEAAAPGWAKWENIFSEAAEPATVQMLDSVEIKPGSRVLDLASGAGNQTIMAGRRVAPDGHVVANDISETMLVHVMENARAAGISNISTLQGAVQHLDLNENEFDAVIGRFCLMLFSGPGDVLKIIRKSIKPGGKISFVVFSAPDQNEFFVKPMQILLKHAGKIPPPPGSPGLFALAAPGALEKLYDECGYSNARVEKMKIQFKMPSAEQVLVMMQEAFGAYRAVIADSQPDVQQAAWKEVLSYLKTIEKENGIEAPSEVLIGSAVKFYSVSDA